MDILDQDDLFIPLPEGTRLAARLWRPADSVPVPAVLEYIPYRKRDATLPRDETIHPWMAAQGHARLRVDIRGTGDSEGVSDDEYSAGELARAPPTRCCAPTGGRISAGASPPCRICPGSGPAIKAATPIGSMARSARITRRSVVRC